MYCSKCGKQNNQDSKFCNSCGSKIDNNVIDSISVSNENKKTIQRQF